MGGAPDEPGPAAAGRPAGMDPAAWAAARQILRHVPAGSVNIFDRDLRYVLAEGTGLSDVGMSPDALVGKTLADLFSPEEVDRVAPYYRQALAGTPVSFELPIGDRIYAINAAPLEAPGLDTPGAPNGAAGYILVVAQEVTARKRVEEALRASEARLQSLMHGNVIGILQAGESRILDANDAFLQMIGYSRADLAAGRVRWRELTPPEWSAADDHAVHEMLTQGAAAPFEKELFRQDGSRVPILIGGTLLTRAPLTWMCFVLDLTARNRAEANERAARLRAEDAVRDRDRLLGVVAHDLRNPLATIQAAAQLLARRLASGAPLDGEGLRRQVAQIGTAATRMNGLIEEIVDSSRIQAGAPLDLQRRPTDLVALVRHVAEERRDRDARHQVEVTAAVPEIIGSWDPHRLERVFANLLDNAIKYSPAGGTIRITVETGGDAGPDDAPGWARVQVADDGIGIPAADLPHIFEWYRRADNAGATATGTGLGLAGARQIVTQHGGTITVASVEGDGATFTVTLPLPAA